MKKFLLLFLLCGTVAFAQDEGALPNIHFVDSSNPVVSSETHDEIFVAIPRDEQKSDFRIIIQEGKDSYTLEFSNLKKLSGKFYSYDHVYYGGRVEINPWFNFNGNVQVDKKASAIFINHNHEFIIYKINLRNFDISPVVHHYVRFSGQYLPDDQMKEIIAQPNNVGFSMNLKGKKGSRANLLLTAGPAAMYDFKQHTPEFKPLRFNFKLTISL